MAKSQTFSELPRWTPRALEPDELATVRLLKIHDVCARVKFSRARVYELMGEGVFPRPIKFSPGRRGAVRWPDVWISEWLAKLVGNTVFIHQEGAR